MFTPTKPYIQPLDNNLILKTVSAEQDIERLAVFNTTIHHDENVGAMTRNLIRHHPNTRPQQWFYIEDEGVIVSTLCLIPWKWRFEGVELKAGEMGIVGTLEAYRRRGLSRALVAHHHHLLREGEYDLSHIQGIPYFYRQFGYEYALPLEGGWRVDLHTVPNDPPDLHTFTFRQATGDDIPALTQLYNDTANDLSISAIRETAVWEYLLGPALETETAAETWLILDGAQEVMGYWRIAKYGFGEGLNVCESSRLTPSAAMASLAQFKAVALARDKPYIRLNLPVEHLLNRTASRYGAHDLGRYAWQIHVPDVARLLFRLGPVFERRIAASPFAGLTQIFVLNLYREAFALRFEDGQLRAVNAIGYVDAGDMRLPPQLLAPLVLGYRNREELAQNYPDVGCHGQVQALADVLFQKVEAFIYTAY